MYNTKKIAFSRLFNQPGKIKNIFPGYEKKFFIYLYIDAWVGT